MFNTNYPLTFEKLYELLLKLKIILQFLPPKKDHMLGIFLRVLQFKKQIRYKRQIKDILHAYMKRYITTK